MKERILTSVALAVMLLSCTVENVKDDVKNPVSGDNTIECSIDNSAKCVLRADNSPVWSQGDELSILSRTGGNARFVLSDGEGLPSGTFRGAFPEDSGLCALFPFDSDNSISGSAIMFSMPDRQECIAGNIDPRANVMVSQMFDSFNPRVMFSNVFGMLQVNLKGNASVAVLTLTSSKDEMLWGDCALSLDGLQGTDGQTLSVTGGSNVLSLVFAQPVALSEGTSKPFFFILPAGVLSEGFTLDIYDAENNLLYTKNTSNDQTIARSVILSMPELDGIDKLPTTDIKPEPTTWAAYNSLKRSEADATIIDPQDSGYPQSRADKFVGAFYFICQCDGSLSGISVPSRPIYDNQKMLGEGHYEYEEIDYGPNGYVHHWGEPYMGYYKSNDAWVIRKHAQMLSDAGVDFIAFDVTNNVFYEAVVFNICNIYKQIRAEGKKTPALTFMIWHSGAAGGAATYSQFNHNKAVTHLYNTFYANHPEYSDLWFKWEGKPVMLANKAHVTDPTIRNYFTFRQSWYIWNKQAQTPDDFNDPWWHKDWDVNKPVDTEDRWPWAVCYTDDTENPMWAGTHNGVNEFCSVTAATHPVSNLGRSYPINQGITYNSGANSYPKQPEKGIYFKSQFEAAKKLDPKIIFFTGWNEWVVGNASCGELNFWYMCGTNNATRMFIDQYNHEFSRDIEPLNGNFGDTYYYYMVDFIRQFKGVGEVPVFSRYTDITIDGKFADWLRVGSAYADDKEDTKVRGYDNGGSGFLGFNDYAYLKNNTGRNDLYISKTATDGSYLYFYVNALNDLTGYSNGENGLNLFIRTDDGSTPHWEGFNFRLMLSSDSRATLSRCTADDVYGWTAISEDISIAVKDKELEAAIPLSLLGISNTSELKVDFKWVDNVNLSAESGIQQCMRDGDSAPNGRFRYRYVFKK